MRISDWSSDVCSSDLIYDGAGNIIERRKDIWHTHYDTPKLSGRITWDPAGDTVANLGGHYQRKYDRYYEDGLRTAPGLPDSIRTVRENADSWNYEIGGDYQFALRSEEQTAELQSPMLKS